MGRRMVPPGPDRAAARAAADAIIARRTGHRDPYLHELGDELAEVVDHVVRPSVTGVDPLDAGDELPAEVLRQDVIDALLVLDHLDMDYARRSARRRLALIDLAYAAGMDSSDLTGPLRQRSRSGVFELRKRLSAVRDPTVGVPSVREARETRKAAQSAAQIARASGSEITDLARDLVAVGCYMPPFLGERAGFDAQDLDYFLSYGSGAVAQPLRLIVQCLTRQTGLRDEVTAVLAKHQHLVDMLQRPARAGTARV